MIKENHKCHLSGTYFIKCLNLIIKGASLTVKQTKSLNKCNSY